MPQHKGEQSHTTQYACGKNSLNSIMHKRTTHYPSMTNCMATSYSWQH